MPQADMAATEAKKPLRIDKYIFTEDDEHRLGSGVFGAVYRGKSAEDDTPFAIKKINSHKLISDVKNLFGLRHPNVTTYFTSISEGPATYIIMELCDTDLAQVLEDGGALDGVNADTLAKNIAQGYFAIHNLNIVHRDIKPSNILLNIAKKNAGKLRIEQAKITDFGSCRLMTEQVSNMAGTPIYMAPEIAATILKPQHYTYEVDMWSIGVLLFESITGRIPFDESDQCRQILQYSTGNFEGYDPPALDGPLTEVPAYLEVAVTNLLQLNPADRLKPKEFCDISDSSKVI